MKIIFLGTSLFAVPALKAVSEMTLAVVSRPDRPAGRGRKLRRPPAAEEAHRLGLKLLQPEKLSDVREVIGNLAPDVMVSASYGAWLPEWLLSIAPLGVLNIHPSLLPRHRGAAPVIRTVLQGDGKTGVSFMLTDSGWDTGDLLKVFEYPVTGSSPAGKLEEELAKLAAEKLPEVLQAYKDGELKPFPQTGAESYAEKVTPEESEINWEAPALHVHRMVLAFNPVPGARTPFRGGILKIYNGEVSGESGKPGTVVRTSPLTVACGTGSYTVSELQPQGKQRMAETDFTRGYRMEPGEFLGSV